MRSSGVKGSAANNIDGPVENGLSHKEGEVVEVQRLAAKVVENVVQRASKEAEQRSSPARKPPKRGCDLPRLPTIQIDTVPSPPWSPIELSPVDDEEEEPIDEQQIDIHLEEEQPSELLSEELRESLRSYVEDLLSQAMVIVEKKLQFVGLDEESEEEEEEEEEAGDAVEMEAEEEVDEEEIRLAAEKVVEEVLSKATETVSEQLERDISGMEFPGLPSFQIDTVVSAPPSPDEEEDEQPMYSKKWNFTMEEESESSKQDASIKEEKTAYPITFEDAPEDVKDAASNLIKEIVGKAITMAEEKATPPVAFNFDVDLMKTSGPWYIRVREALLRVLRSACFCTPRRSDS